MTTDSERLDRVEREVQRVDADVQALRESGVVAGLRAQAYGLSLVQGEVADLRTEMREGFAAVNGRIDGMAGRFDGIEETLRQIVARLPE